MTVAAHDPALLGPANPLVDDPSMSSLSKALSILERLSRSRAGVMGVTALAREAGLPKSTAHRLLKTMEGHGVIERSGSQYILGSQFFEMSSSAIWATHNTFYAAAQPALNELFHGVAETVQLTVLNGRDVLYLEKICGRDGTRVASRVGGRAPAVATASGRVMLAHMPADTVPFFLQRRCPRRTVHSVIAPRLIMDRIERARLDRVAYEMEESRLGIVSVAAAIVEAGGVVRGAVEVSGPSPRFRPATAAKAVRLAADAIARNSVGL